MNKGFFKIIFTKPWRFVINKTAFGVEAMFTMQQCRLGFIHLWHNVTIHLLFVDIIIDYLPLKNKEVALEYIECEKQTDARIRKIIDKGVNDDI